MSGKLIVLLCGILLCVAVPLAAAVSAPPLLPAQNEAALFADSSLLPFDAPDNVSGDVLLLNAATLPQLMTLNGMDVVLAQRILAARALRGGFRTKYELLSVEGVTQNLLLSWWDRLAL